MDIWLNSPASIIHVVYEFPVSANLSFIFSNYNTHVISRAYLKLLKSESFIRIDPSILLDTQSLIYLVISLFSFSASFANILLGTHHRYQYDPNNLALKSTKFYIHPEYNAVRIENDIGLVELPQPVNFTSDYTFSF